MLSGGIGCLTPSAGNLSVHISKNGSSISIQTIPALAGGYLRLQNAAFDYSSSTNDYYDLRGEGNAYTNAIGTYETFLRGTCIP